MNYKLRISYLIEEMLAYRLIIFTNLYGTNICIITVPCIAKYFILQFVNYAILIYFLFAK